MSQTDVEITPGGPRLSLDVVVTRGRVVESRHCVSAAVVSADGEMLASAGRPDTVAWWRSCAKPFQVLPLLEHPKFDGLGWGVDQIALACASHGGEPEHVAIAGGMLVSLGLEEGDLACGPHEPLAARGSRLMRESGTWATRLHNNCSGKHAAMLARALLSEWPTEGYEGPDHPVQRAALESVSRWAGIPTADVKVAVDGCGVSVFALPLTHMALAYARLAAAASRGDEWPARVVQAMTQHPFLVGGSDRFDTVLMEAYGGRVLCKIGAEGVHTLALVERGIGLAIKVEDGAPRAQYPAVMALLDYLGEAPDQQSDALREYRSRVLRNSRNEPVGEIRVARLRVGDQA